MHAGGAVVAARVVGNPAVHRRGRSVAAKRARRGSVRCALSGGDEDDASLLKPTARQSSVKTAAPAAEPSKRKTSSTTIDALCALLGDECEDEEAKREEEADLARAARAAANEAARAAKDDRRKAFRAASTAALRLQQLQLVFLDLPVVPRAFRGAFLDELEKKEDRCATAGDLPETEWFDARLPADDPFASVKTSSAGSDGENNPGRGDGLIPEYVEYDGERLPGEFSIPVVPYPFACVPGSRVRLNLFEPRWLTLFAKLLTEAPAAQGSAPSPKMTPPLVLEGASDDNRIDLRRNEQVQAYEAGDDDAFDIVPGLGRMDESPFVGTGRFGAVYRRGDGKLAGVGTAMTIAAHDVVVNGKLLSVYATGTTRFRVLRVRQVNPYLVVDAVPIVDVDDDAEEKSDTSEVKTSDDDVFASNIVAGASGKPESLGDSVVGGGTDEAGFGTGSPSAARLAGLMERLISADPYYSDAVGLEEAWTRTGLQRVVRGMNEFDVANTLLYERPETALRLLASRSRADRAAALMDVIRGMEAALAAGITPRKARLMRFSASFAAVFSFGFALSYVREFVEATWGVGGGGPGF